MVAGPVKECVDHIIIPIVWSWQLFFLWEIKKRRTYYPSLVTVSQRVTNLLWLSSPFLHSLQLAIPLNMEEHMQRSLLASGYEPLELIGEGAYGIVWWVLLDLEAFRLCSPSSALLSTYPLSARSLSNVLLLSTIPCFASGLYARSNYFDTFIMKTSSRFLISWSHRASISLTRFISCRNLWRRISTVSFVPKNSAMIIASTLYTRYVPNPDNIFFFSDQSPFVRLYALWKPSILRMCYTVTSSHPTFSWMPIAIWRLTSQSFFWHCWIKSLLASDLRFRSCSLGSSSSQPCQW